METDNGKRGSNGVVLSLVQSAPGQLRLVADDVNNESGSECGPWKHSALYTFQDFASDQILDHKLSDKQLADLGSAILVRLGVLHECATNRAVHNNALPEDAFKATRL